MNVPGDPQDGGQYPVPVGYGQNPAGYDQGLGHGAPPARPRNGFGILALVFGLLGRARAQRGESTNGGLSVAGAVLGIIGLLIAIGLIAMEVSLLHSPAGQGYRQCLQRSGGDPAKIQQCAAEFGRQLEGG